MNPEIWALIADVTQYCDKDLVKHTGRVFDVYVTDITVGYHLCSLSTAYECHFIWNITENSWDDLPYDVRRALEDAEANQMCEYPVTYYAKHTVDAAEVIEPVNLPSAEMGKWKIDGWDWDEIRAQTEGQVELMDVVTQAVREGGL